MKAKIKLPAIIFYLTGIILVTVSIALFIKANLGLSTITSVPYTIFQITNWLSVGMLMSIVQMMFITSEMIILKKATVSMALTFVTAYLMGLLIDLFNFLFIDLEMKLFIVRLTVAFGSTITLGTGATLLIFSRFPPIPDLIFVRDIGQAKGISPGKLKQIVDASFFTISLVLSLIFLRGNITVGIGTLFGVLIVGRLINFLRPKLEDWFQCLFLIGEDRFVGILETNVFELLKNKKSEME